MAHLETGEREPEVNDELARALEDARKQAEDLIEQALRRGSELAKKVEEMEKSGDPEKARRAKQFLEGKTGPETLL